MMLTKTGRFALTAAVLCIGFGAGGGAEAGGIVLGTPAGLKPGDSFRFVFVTDGGTDATSANISDYNAFVNSQAGGATYNGSVVTWDAIVSTSSTDAINNVGEHTSAIPIYEASGVLVTSSDNSSGLWSGSIINPIILDLAGANNGALGVWTGTTASGTGDANLQLGAGVDSQLGLSGFVNSRWVSDEAFISGDRLPLYGISQVLIVQSSVPEPSSLLMAVTALSAGCAFGWSRRRRNQRPQRTVEQPDTPE